MKVISSERLPIKMWLEDIEDGALQQAKNLANLPFAYKHIAIMPDSHQGYGMPIGGVLATEGVIIPNAVGVDIGCGMCAVKTSLTEINTETLKKIMGEIRKVIPVGFKKHDKAQNIRLMPLLPDEGNIVWANKENALKSLGTLGSGNHFIEIQKGSDGHIWIMIHSGSRNLGKQVADYYNKIAKDLNAKWHVSVPKEHDLAFLPVDSDEGQNYIKEMNYCVEFALANRKLMMERIKKVFLEIIEEDTRKKQIKSATRLSDINLEFEPIINIAHNYASLEHHFGKNVWVHRKGATLAREGTIGIIPGSQGTKSYIVKGKGNKESFESCSHGAGRAMSRTEAKKTLNLEEEIAKMEAKGIIHGMRHQNDLDEASGSYKDIDVVMANQSDLVDILITLEPIAVIKG